MRGARAQDILLRPSHVLPAAAERRLPRPQSGAAEYLSVTVLEGHTPESLLAFFNADAHRMTWCGPCYTGAALDSRRTAALCDLPSWPPTSLIRRLISRLPPRPPGPEQNRAYLTAKTWRRRDDMLVDFSVLASDEATGAEVVRWVRRFPLMCAPRDYVFSRRSWADGCGALTPSAAAERASLPPRCAAKARSGTCRPVL